ncbi:MAG: hypothetical protein RLZZ511_4119 [Cyanobacteriota bacterium]|jgi:hypothetical protein
MNIIQTCEEPHPSKGREIGDQIKTILRRYPGIPRESVYVRLRSSDLDSIESRRADLIEAMRELLQSGAVVEVAMGIQRLLYLKGEQPSGVKVCSFHQPALKTWVDPSVKGTYQPTKPVVDESAVAAIRKEHDDRAVRDDRPGLGVAKRSNSDWPIAPSPQGRKKLAEPRRSICTSLRKSEAEPFLDLMAQRKITASEFLRQMVLDFVAQATAGPIATVAESPSPKPTLEALVADLNRANQRLVEFVLAASGKS